MTVITTFKRHELKYLLTKQQSKQLKDKMAEYTVLDQYAKHTIHTVYFDTDDYLLIRRSIEKPEYKEKLRIRSYGNTQENSDVFVEVKKKYKGVVYKRRVALPREEAFPFVVERVPLQTETQITREIDYFLSYYHDLKPSMLLSYDREAYISKKDENLRLTFDTNVRSRQEDLLNINKVAGERVIEKDCVLLEVKTILGLPTWLLEFLGENEIYKTSFSKYGNAYKQYLVSKKEEEQLCQ